MTETTPILAPSGYAPTYAVGFADDDGNYAPVAAERPLPVTLEGNATAITPLAGTTTVDRVAGPFRAVAGKVITVALEGEWTGTARLVRSIDNGLTMQTLRVAGEPWAQFAASGIEQAWFETEDNASYYLDITIASGTLAYRVSQ